MFKSIVTTAQGYRSVKISLNASTVDGAKREAGKWLNEHGSGHSVTVYGDGFYFTKSYGGKWSNLINC